MSRPNLDWMDITLDRMGEWYSKDRARLSQLRDLISYCRFLEKREKTLKAEIDKLLEGK